jgi:CRP-like cAMP-binding protein
MARIEGRLQSIELPFNSDLLAHGARVDALYFVERGTVSMVALLANGARIEVGLVGVEGVVGLPLLFGTRTSPLEALVQVEGKAMRLSAEGLRTSLRDTPALLPILLRYVDTFVFQIAQTAACNGSHRIEQRLARWLLMELDRAEGDSFAVTHELLSIMLGVRRPGVTVAMGLLREAGLVEQTRRGLRVLDRPGLEAAACECYALVNRRTQEAMQRPAEGW